MNRTLLLLAAAALLAACSQAKPAPELPPHPTAVLHTYVHNFGYQGNFATESNRTTRTRADMQRVDDDFQFTGAIMSHITSAKAAAGIVRLDKNQLWRLNPKDHEYTECAISGCGGPPGAPTGGAPPSGGGRPAGQTANSSGGQQGQSACPIHLVKTDVTVDKTGQTRSVNGFDATEYQVTWLTVTEDDQHRQDTSTLKVNIWTTTPTPQMQAVLDMEQAFGRSFGQKMRQTQPLVLPNMPPEATGIFYSNFMAGQSSADRAKMMEMAKKFSQIKGYPVSTKIEWYADTKTCGRGEQPQQKSQSSSGLSVGSLVGSLMEKKSDQDSGPTPIFRYVQEIKAMDVEPVTDSLFQPPADYKLVNRS